MHSPDLKRYLTQLVWAIIVLATAAGLYQVRQSTSDSEKIVERFRHALQNSEISLNKHLDEFIQQYRLSEGEAITNINRIQEYKKDFFNQGIIYHIYEDDQLIFWSTNIIPLENNQAPEKNMGASHKKNGWYLYEKQETENTVFVAYYLLKEQYRYQNRFLVNRFHHQLPDVEELFYLSDRADIGWPIYNQNNDYLFSLVLRREAALVQNVKTIHIASALIAVLSMLMVVFFSFRYYSNLFNSGKRLLATLGFGFTLLLFRAVSFVFSIPGVFYEGTLFSPEMYATSDLFPSLGDLFLNVALVTIVGYFLFYNYRNIEIKPATKKSLAIIQGFFLFAAIFLICGLALYLIEGLVINSHLTLDVQFIFSMDIYNLMGFLIIGLVFFALFFYSVVLCRLAQKLIIDKKHFWITCAGSLILLFLITWVLHGFLVLLFVLTIAAIIVYELDQRSTFPQKGFTALVLSLFLFSIISTFALYRFNEEKDREKRKTLALQLAFEQDPVAEFLFLEIEDALFNDNQLQNLVRRDPYNDALILNYLQYHYFYDFWAKYDIQVTVCVPNELLWIKPDNVEIECAVFFDEYIQSVGKQTVSDRFIYLDNDTGRNSYILKMKIGKHEDEHLAEYHLYVEFDSKIVMRDMGFPELLIDETIDINRELINYSYAVYKNEILVNESGTYMFHVSFSAFGEVEDEFTFMEFDGYTHLIYKKDDKTIYVVSRPKTTFLEALAPFSYLFVSFFILIIVFWLLFSEKKKTRLFKINFRRRIQYSMIIILVVSALTMGSASAWFLYNIYQNKTNSFLSEKTISVLLELEADLAAHTYLDQTMEFFMYDLLLGYSHVFFTDINLYNQQGQLIASSRPKVFEEGLVGRKMNPIAYHQMKKEHRSQFIHNEKIGKLQYLSAYTPVYNQYNRVIAYLNLPYFAKQSELRNEVTYFLVAFINIYLLMVVLAIVLALFVSNYITKPMQVIRDNLASLQLGKANQKIEWTREDEIGSLIAEYNRMIDELAISAELLARSERETAWREMARQVAHEIKNPLTPMKLSVQYLQKAWKENVPDWDDRLERFTKTMIEQIDNMSVIAREFSDFAKMPMTKNDFIDLRSVIPEVLDLYKNLERIEMVTEMPSGTEPLNVYADRSQLLRVFNNLIKNAIQSYDRKDIAYIRVRCSGEEGFYRIAISDKGCGIPENKKEKVFDPYFTTKAKGMGLGLSIVKNIIEGFGGNIWFYSKEEEGSEFVFTLPAAEKRGQQPDYS
ncbi:MAG: HAMP domain-containing protein [Bacteroidia bacterium]|nr:MAG: HAMP domain-containing protein [Bacteroidia bacterium]